MNVDDKIVCIKPFYLPKFEYNGYIKPEIDIKIGDIFTIISIKDYIGEGLIEYTDVQVFLVSNNNIKQSFFSRELSYRWCIYDHFTLLAPFRDKRIDEILND